MDFSGIKRGVNITFSKPTKRNKTNNYYYFYSFCYIFLNKKRCFIVILG